MSQRVTQWKNAAIAFSIPGLLALIGWATIYVVGPVRTPGVLARFMIPGIAAATLFFLCIGVAASMRESTEEGKE